MAGIFEETARYLSFKLLKKKYHDFPTALSYGVGHGGIEAILLGGLAMINSMVVGILINIDITKIAGQVPETVLPQLNAQISALVSTAPYMFLVAGGERLAAICIQVSLSVIVFYSVANKSKWRLFPLAILLHAAVDVPAALSQVGVISDIRVIEGYIVICAILLSIFAIYIHRRSESGNNGGRDNSDSLRPLGANHDRRFS
jgi:uncharacterized membrane protein YhfC